MATRSVRETRVRRVLRRSGTIGALAGLALLVGLILVPPVAVAEEPSGAPTLEELGLPKVAGIALGLTSGCLWGEDGSAWCWGSNHSGELGIGPTSDEWTSVPVRVEGIPGRVRQMTADEQTTCALTDGGGVWCWGENMQGEVGDGTTDDRATPTAVTGLGTGVAAIAAADFGNHRCAVLGGGGAACWGDNSSGQLGGGTWEDQGPIRVTVVTEKIVAMATTNNQTCAVTAGGAVRCWGWLWDDPTGKTDGAPEADSAVLTPRGLGSGVRDVALADDTACALMTDGEVKCWSWGRDRAETDLVPSYAWRPGQVPEVVTGLPGGMDTIHLSHYAWSEESRPDALRITTSACATRDGDAWCWGGNHGGQLGDGTTTDRPSPVRVETDDIAQLATSWGDSLALLGDGSLLTWGSGDPTPRSPFWRPVAPSTTGYRPPDTLVPTITTQIPTPADISTDPPVVGANLLLAAFAMIVFTFSTELLNRHLGQLDPVLVQRLRPIGWIDRGRARLDAALPGRFAGMGHARLADALRLLGIAAFYGIVFSLLDPTWDPFSITGMWLVLIMAVSFGLVGLSGDIAAWAMARRWGVASELAVRPGSLVTAVGSTLLTRALVIVPGVMIGSPEALDIDAEHTDRRRLGGLAGVGLGTVLAIGFVAWLASLGTTAFTGTEGFGGELIRGIGALLLLVFAGAVQNGFVQLLSLRESAGLALRRTHRIPWAMALLVVTFLFWHTLVNPRGDLAEAVGSTNVQAFMITVGVVFAAAIVVWVASIVTRRRAPAGAGSVELSGVGGEPPPAPDVIGVAAVSAAVSGSAPSATLVAPEAPGPGPGGWSEPVPAPPAAVTPQPPSVVSPAAGWSPQAGSVPTAAALPIAMAAPPPPAVGRARGTCEATAVTLRQWFGMNLAIVVVVVISVWAFAVSLELLTGTAGMRDRMLSETQLFLMTWSYVHRDGYPPVIGYAFPPITLWVGLVMLWVGTANVAVWPNKAVRTARGGLKSRRAWFSWSESRSLRDAGRHLSRQLHERGRAGLFRGGNVRIGVGLAGGGLVLLTAVLGSTSVTTSGVAVQGVERGLLPSACLVGSVIALAGLVLSFPFGPREKVIIDVAGNVSSARVAAAPLAVPSSLEDPAFGSATPPRRWVAPAGWIAPSGERVAAAPVTVAAAPVTVAAQPVAVAAAPVVVAAQPVVVAAQPVAVAAQPVAVAAQPVAVAAAPVIGDKPPPLIVASAPVVESRPVAVVVPPPAVTPLPPPRMPPVAAIPPPPPTAPTAPAITYCPGCGTRWIEGARFCIACGAAFAAFARS